jgi:hypothetical protein
MYNGLGRPVASSNCNTVGIDIGGRGIVAGTGEGGAGSTGSARPLAAALELAGGALCRPSRSRGGGREAEASGLNEFRRVGSAAVECW